MRSIEIEQSELTDFKNPEKIVIPDFTQELWVSNVFGINKEGQLPARFLSGFISTFSLARLITERTEGAIVPTVRIFRPINISRHINGISEEASQWQITRGSEVLALFAKNHFPEIPFFVEDDGQIIDEALEILSGVSTLISDHCEPELLKKLTESGRKRGGEEGARNALVYAAHHPFGWSDLHHRSIFEQIPPGIVINTMPPSERKFLAVRDFVKDALGSGSGLATVTTQSNLFINMCGTPHYILLENTTGEVQEPTLDQSLGVMCKELLADLNARRAGADFFTEENLKRCRRDLERLMLMLAGGDSGVLSEVTFGSLLNGGAR